MPISVTDSLITLAEATAMLPRRRGGKRPAFATIWRWVIRGCYGVKLEAISVGGTLCTTRDALDHFMQRVTEARGIGLPRKSQPNRENPRSAKVLERAGIR